MVDRYKPELREIQATAYCAAHPDGKYVKGSDYDALAARLAELEAVVVNCHREIYSRDARLAEAERLLREWRQVADIAKDMTFVPIAKATDVFFGTADSASAAPCGCRIGECAGAGKPAGKVCRMTEEIRESKL